MAIRLGSAYGKIEIDASGVRDGIESAQQTVNGFGDAMRNVFTFAAGQVVARGFQMLTSGMAGMARSALDSASQLQNLGLAMETLVAREIATTQGIELTEAMAGAGEAAESLLADLQELAIVSPFEYTTVSNVLRVQMAFGATSDQAMDLTRAILNTGAALGQTGADLDRMNYNLAQALVMGDLTGANLRQLKMAGLDLAGILQGELGMSIEEVRAALEDGSLTMEKVSEAFVAYTDKNFGGAAERMSKTFTGLKSSISDLWFFAGADLLTPALEVATEVLGELFDEANEIVRSGALKKVGEQLGEGLREAVMWLKEEAVPRLVEFGEVFRRVTLPRIREFVSGGIEWLMEQARPLWAWITETAIPRLREWGEIFKREVLPRIREFVSTGLIWLWERGQALWAWITGTAIPTLRKWGEVFRSEILPRVQEFVREAMSGLRSLYEIFEAGGLGGLLRTLGSGIATAVREFVQGIDWKVMGQTIIGNLGSGLKAGAALVSRAAQPLVDRVSKFLREYDWQALGQQILERIGEGLQTAYDTIRTWVVDMAARVRESIQQIDWRETAQVLLTKIGEGIGTAYEIIKGWASRILSSLGQSLSEVDWSAVGQSLLDGLESAFKSVKTWMDETGSGLGISMGLKVAGGLGLVSGPAGLAASALLLVTNHLDKIKEAASGVADSVREKMPTLMESFDHLRNFWTEHGPGISESINNVFGKAIEVIGELAAEIIPWAIDQFAKITAWMDENGPLIEDFIKVISDAAIFMLDKVGGLWKIVEPILTGVIDGVLGIAKVIMQVATGDWAGAWETIKETAGKTWEHIKEAFRGAVDFILSFLDTNWEEVSSTWQSNWEMLKIIVDEYFIQPLQDAIDSVTEIIGGVVQDVQNLVKTFEELTGINLPDWLTPGSPTPFELGLRGIAEAIKSMPNLAASLAGGLTAPQLAPAPMGAVAGGGSGSEAPIVNFYGPITVEGVQDVPSFLEQLTKMADGR